MAFDIDRARRLESMAIDERTRVVLRELLPIVMPHLDSIIEAAYKQILRYPDAAKAYETVSLSQIIAAQRRHWVEDLFPATFSEQQLQGAVELFLARQKMGLNLRWYFVFYATLLRNFILKVGPAYRKKPERLFEAVDALTTVLMLDLELASASFMQGAEDDAAAFMRQSADDLQSKVGRLAGAVNNSATDLRTAAQTMTAVADKTTEQADSAAAASQMAEDNIQSAAAATEELTASIHEISRQVVQSTEIASSAVGEAQRTDTMIQGLASAVGKIGAIVKLINDIASQTNLLALNATIEAARAGDAGKGFAVVAGEVKNLANQTAKATEEISAQISAVQTATKEAVGAIQGIGATIGKISEIATVIASAVEEQGAATQEIARSVQQAAASGSTVHTNIRSVNASAGEAEQTARTVLTGADSLVSGVEALQQELGGLSNQVSRFLEQVRKN